MEDFEVSQNGINITSDITNGEVNISLEADAVAGDYTLDLPLIFNGVTETITKTLTLTEANEVLPGDRPFEKELYETG